MRELKPPPHLNLLVHLGRTPHGVRELKQTGERLAVGTNMRTASMSGHACGGCLCFYELR